MAQYREIRNVDEDPWGAGTARPKNDFEAAAANVTRFVQSVATFKKLVGDMGTQRDSTLLRSQLRTARDASTSLAQDTAKSLHAAQEKTQDSGMKLRLSKVLQQFKEAVANLKSIEHTYQQNEQKMARPVDVSVQRPQTYQPPVQDMAVEERRQQALAQQQEEASRRQIEQERAADMRQAHADLIMLSGMMQDINTMLVDQGNMVDDLESNIEVTVDNVQKGTEELGEARRLLSSYRCKKCICWTVIVILIAVLVIGLVFGLMPKKS